MAACAYVRTTTASKVNVNFFIGKTKVAPLKQESISKLELHAAVTGSRLCIFVLDELRFEPIFVFYWTDSTTVLAWFKNMPRRKDFRSSRVTEILYTSKEPQETHISGNRNAADNTTRRKPLSDVDKLWFQPPDFLLTPKPEWFKPSQSSAQDKERSSH